MGLLRYILKKERLYRLLAGIALFFFVWTYLTSQDNINSLRNERHVQNRPVQNILINSDVTGRKLQIKPVLSPSRLPPNQYGVDDNDEAKDPLLRQGEDEESMASQIRIGPPLNHAKPQNEAGGDVASYFKDVPALPNPANKIQNQRHQETGISKKRPLKNDLPRLGHRAFDKRLRESKFAPEGGNALPNYFMHAESINKTRKQYGDAIVTYLHHNKAAGSSVKDCLHKVSGAQRRGITLLDSNGRVSSVKRKQRSSTFRFYMGGYSFGICQQISTQPCSYFTFVRDPYERVISSYSYCRRANTDQLCVPGNPWAMNIKEWVLFQGSFLFRQILFRPEFCSYNLSRDKLRNELSESKQIKRTASCWFKEKVYLKENMNQTTEDDLIDYVVSNLDRWFAVIGLTEEYDTSLAMLEETYGLPFHTRCSGKKINVSDYRNLKEKPSANETEHDAFVRRTKEELMADEDVQRALRADLRIYEQAKLIFEKQREKYKQLHDLSDRR